MQRITDADVLGSNHSPVSCVYRECYWIKKNRFYILLSSYFHLKAQLDSCTAVSLHWSKASIAAVIYRRMEENTKQICTYTYAQDAQVTHK